MRIDAVLFDMDGVVTDTARAHAAAWKRLFDDYLQARSASGREAFRPFDEQRDYRRFIDGKPRHEGTEAFLASRGLSLPRGRDDDGVDQETVCGLGNRKNRYYRGWLAAHTVQTFPGALRLIGDLRRAGVKVAVFSASRNARAVLASAQVADLFDATVDGVEAAALGLPGKPDPATLLEAARRVGVPPGRAAVVEDSAAGVEAGIRGGFGLVIGVDRTGTAAALAGAGAHVVVQHLGEVVFAPGQGLTVKTLPSLPLVSDRAGEIRGRLEGRVPALFLDYDGTLTPIVADFTKAVLSGRMREALAAAARRGVVAIVSGRDVDWLRRLVQLDAVYYAGNHGFEIAGPSGWHDGLEMGADLLPALDEAERLLSGRLADVAGCAVERKRFSLAVHYRAVAAGDVRAVEAAVDDALKGTRLRKGHGKKVFRIQPDVDWDKGRAVAWLLDRLHLRRADVLPIYVGDDLTDEDAFRALAGHGLSVVVRDGSSRATAADYAVEDPEGVRQLLELVTAGTGDRGMAAGGSGVRRDE